MKVGLLQTELDLVILGRTGDSGGTTNVWLGWAGHVILGLRGTVGSCGDDVEGSGWVCVGGRERMREH